MLDTCAQCTTRYPPDLDRCPHCGSTEKATVGDQLAYPDGVTAAEVLEDLAEKPKPRGTKARAQAAEAVGEAGP